jgi:PAS domain S-box-containing protein
MRDRSSAGTALDDVTIYEQIVEQMDDAAFVVDAERRLRYANSSALEYAETSLEVIQHVPITTLAEEMIATEAGRERFERALDAVFAGDTDRESLTLELALASETLIGEYKFSPLTEAGSVVGVIVVARDVTELRRELREQSRILEQISENVVEVVWMNEPEQDDIQYVSAAYEDVWGRDREVLYEDPHAFVDAIHPEDRERVLDALDDQQADPDAYDETYRIVRPDGDVRWIHDCASGVYDEDGSLQRIVGVARDVTERKERERELSLYERVIEEAPVGITITDLGREDNPLTYVNERFEEITGYTAADCLGRNCRFLQGNNTDPSRVHQFREAIDTAEATTVELRNYRADGEAFWNRVSIAPVTDDDGAVSNYVGFQEDVTDHKRREQDLEQFAYAASHDLREPLRVISNYLQLLERRHGDQLDADAHEYVEYATDAAERMRDRIEGLLTYARVDQDENLEPVDLDDVVETVRSDLEIAIEQNDAKIIVGDLPTVEGNAEQLATVFQNLLDNALAHGGDDPPVVEISAEPQDGMWALTVADEGVGMAPEQVERAFDLFERFAEDGTGLGLALCEKVVEHHGGTIRIDAAPSDGTAVKFTLPESDK